MNIGLSGGKEANAKTIIGNNNRFNDKTMWRRSFAVRLDQLLTKTTTVNTVITNTMTAK